MPTAVTATPEGGTDQGGTTLGTRYNEEDTFPKKARKKT